jgi:hypothetical protein
MDQLNTVNRLPGDDANKYEDDQVATILLADFEEQKMRVKEDGMRSTRCGKAYLFVESVHNLVVDLLGQFGRESDDKSKISTVALDGMVPLAERMMAAQEKFRKAGKPHCVDIAYHYTVKECIERIQIHGLLTKKERRYNHIEVANEHGCTFGDGVYTSNNPFCFSQYGDVGLLVARLQGNTERDEQQHLLRKRPYDTIIGNKETREKVYLGTYYDFDEVVLTDSEQCLALVQFPSSLIPESARTIYKLQVEMKKLVDVFFNGKGEIYHSTKTQVRQQFKASCSLETSKLEHGIIEGVYSGPDTFDPKGTIDTKPQGRGSLFAWNADLHKYRKWYQDIMGVLIQTDPDNAPKCVRIFQQSISQWNKGLDQRYEHLLNITIERLKQLPERNHWRKILESLIENELASSVVCTGPALLPVAMSLTPPVALETSVSFLYIAEQKGIIPTAMRGYHLCISY